MSAFVEVTTTEELDLSSLVYDFVSDTSDLDELLHDLEDDLLNDWVTGYLHRLPALLTRQLRTLAERTDQGDIATITAWAQQYLPMTPNKPDAVKETPLWHFANHPNKAAVIEAHRDWNIDLDWWDYSYECMAGVWRHGLGITVDPNDMGFSGFYSQGDGARFTRATVDWAVLLAAKAQEWEVDKRFRLLRHHLPLLPQPEFSTRDNFYVHERTVSISLDWHPADLAVLADQCLHQQYPQLPPHHELHRYNLGSWYDEATARFEHQASLELNALDELFSDLCLNMMGDLYGLLEEEYEYLTSDSAVADALAGSDYLFEIDGTLA